MHLYFVWGERREAKGSSCLLIDGHLSGQWNELEGVRTHRVIPDVFMTCNSGCDFLLERIKGYFKGITYMKIGPPWLHHSLSK